MRSWIPIALILCCAAFGRGAELAVVSVPSVSAEWAGRWILRDLTVEASGDLTDTNEHMQWMRDDALQAMPLDQTVLELSRDGSYELTRGTIKQSGHWFCKGDCLSLHGDKEKAPKTVLTVVFKNAKSMNAHLVPEDSWTPVVYSLWFKRLP